jgi:predicted lipoprotein
MCWWVPLFHLRPLKASQEQTASAAFNAPVFVAKFWDERLMKSLAVAVDAAKLIDAIKQDPKQARAKYGRTMGLSSTYYYFVMGAGKVVSVDKNSVSVALGDAATADVVLETGNVFGNAARDATGLLDVNDFPNSREFNDIAAELNRRIEETILPALRTNAVIGTMVRFAGCAELTDDGAAILPLHLIPLRAEIP